jgi:hypothetical protein
VKREIVSLLKARNDAGGVVLLRPGTVIDAFHIMLCAEPGAEGYVAQFDCERGALWCPLHSFLPRTRIVDDAIAGTGRLIAVAATA